jgi:hypothetical protein
MRPTFGPTMTLYMAQQRVLRRTNFGANVTDKFGHTNPVREFVLVQTLLILQRLLTDLTLWPLCVDGVHVMGVVNPESYQHFSVKILLELNEDAHLLVVEPILTNFANNLGLLEVHNGFVGLDHARIVESFVAQVTLVVFTARMHLQVTF